MAIQAGKQETSGLFKQLESLMETKLQQGIKKYVNGHMRDIKEHLEAQDDILADLKTNIEIVKTEQIRLKNDTDPIIDSKKTITNVGKFIMWIGGIILIITGVYKAFIK